MMFEHWTAIELDTWFLKVNLYITTTAGLGWTVVFLQCKYTLNFHSSGGKIDFPFSPSGPGTPLNPSRPGLPGNPLCPFSPILLESRPGLPFY